MEAAGVDALPTTVDELIAAGKKAKAAGFEGFAVRHQMNEFNGWAYDFPSWVIGFGGGWSDGENLTIDSPKNITGVSEYKRVFDSGIVPIGDDASTFRSKFKENQLMCIIDNSGTPNALSVGGAITGADIIAGPLPFPEPGAHQKLILGVNANGDNVAAAKAFVAWVASAEGQQALRPSIGASTMATDIPLDADYLTEMPWAAAYEEIGKTSRSGIPAGFETRADEIMGAVLAAVERIVTTGVDPATELAKVQAELE
jgi:multiple sugar transport system substrate-binding protein